MNYLRIKELKLRNITCYENQQITFSQGNNILLGSNGSGKSTILNSIGIGLFGVKYLTGMPFKIKDIVKRGYHSGRITLTFETRSGEFLSEFIIGERSNSWKLFKLHSGRKQQIATTISETKEYIQRLLGTNIDEKTFKNAICSTQGSIDRLLMNSDAERGEEIRKVLGLNRFNDLETHMNNITRNLQNKIQLIYSEEQILEERVEDPEDIRKQLKEKEQVYEEVTDEKTETEMILKRISQEIKQLEETERQKEQVKTKLELLQRTLVDTEKEVGTKEKSMEEIIKTEQLPREHSKILELKNRLQKRSEEILDIMSGLRNDLEVYETKRGNIVALQDEIKEEQSALEKLITSQHKLLGSRKIDELKEEKESLKSQLTQLVQSIKQKDEILLRVKAEIEDISKRRKKALLELTEIRKKFKQAFGVDISQIADVEARLKEDKKQIGTSIEEKEHHIEGIKKKQAFAKSRLVEIEQVIKLLDVSDPTTQNCPTCERKFEGIDITSLLKKQKERKKELQQKEQLLNSQIERARAELHKMKENQEKTLRSLHQLASFSLTRASELEKLERELREILSEKKLEEEDLNKQLMELKRQNPRELEDKINALSSSIKEVEALILKEAEVRVSIRTKREQIQKIEGEIMNFDSEVVRDKLRRYRTERMNLNGKIPVIEKAITLSRAIEEKKQAIQNITNSIQETEHRLQEFPVLDEKKLKELKIQESSTHRRLGKITEKLNQVQMVDLPLLKRKLSESLNDQQKLLKLKEKKEKYKKAMDTYALLKSLFKEIPNRLLYSISESISRVMTQRMQSMYPKRNINKIVLRPDGELSIHIAGQKVDIKTLSGGERTALGLALRIALAMHVAPLEFMILDEPTNHMDNNRIEELVTIVENRTLLNSPNGQLLLVTHRDEFESAANQVILIEEEPSGKRKVTVK